MKRSLTLRPRERRLALTAAVAIGSWALIAWVVQPLWERIRDLRLRVQSRVEKMDAVSRILSQAPAIERNYQQLIQHLEAGEAGEGAHDVFLNELETLSRRASLQLSLKPRSTRADERMSRFEVELDLEGTQEALFSFLDALLAMPKLMTIERLRIASVPAKPSVLRANLVLQKLSLRSP